MNTTNVCEILQRLKSEQGLSQSEIGKLIGVSSTSVHLWRSKKREVSKPCYKLLKSMALNSRVSGMLKRNIKVKTIDIVKIEQIRSKIIIDNKIITKTILAERIGVKAAALNQWYAETRNISLPCVKIIILIRDLRFFIHLLEDRINEKTIFT